MESFIKTDIEGLGDIIKYVSNKGMLQMFISINDNLCNVSKYTSKELKKFYDFLEDLESGDNIGERVEDADLRNDIILYIIACEICRVKGNFQLIEHDYDFEIDEDYEGCFNDFSYDFIHDTECSEKHTEQARKYLRKYSKNFINILGIQEEEDEDDDEDYETPAHNYRGYRAIPYPILGRTRGLRI